MLMIEFRRLMHQIIIDLFSEEKMIFSSQAEFFSLLNPCFLVFFSKKNQENQGFLLTYQNIFTSASELNLKWKGE